MTKLQAKGIVLGRNSLKRIQELFPNVRRVRDAKRGVTIRVLPEDSTKGRRKDPQSCALARACVREHIADAAIIGVGSSWLVKGRVATRYKTSTGVGREIVSFDRHQDFAAGADYRLSRIPPSCRMNAHRKAKRGPGLTTRREAFATHKTAGIRVIKK